MTNRVLIGDLGGGAWGIRVSKAGVNVLTAGPGDLTLDSEATHLRSIQAGTFTITAGNLTGSASISGLSGTDTFGGRLALVDGAGIEQVNLAGVFESLEITQTEVAATLESTSGSDIVVAYHVMAY